MFKLPLTYLCNKITPIALPFGNSVYFLLHAISGLLYVQVVKWGVDFLYIYNRATPECSVCQFYSPANGRHEFTAKEVALCTTKPRHSQCGMTKAHKYMYLF